MNLTITRSIVLILFVIICSSLLAFRSEASKAPSHLNTENDELKALAFEVLNTKCNSCHRRQNPFFIFNRRNMERRAERIFKAVYVEKRMPKAGGEKLSQEESYILKRWLETQNQ
jgi:hypothetical protein